MNHYQKTYQKILYQIKKDGIPKYVKKFRPNKKDLFSNQDDFYKFVSDEIKKYHPHTYLDILKKNDSNNNKDKPVFKANLKKLRPPTKFSIKNGIGIIKLYQYIRCRPDLGDTKEDYEKIESKYKNEIKNFISNKDLKGLIIDFQNHHGGSMFPLIEAFNQLFENTTLYAWGNKKAKKDDKLWTNVKNGKINSGQKFLKKDINTNIPIAIIIGPNTYSSGEIVASCFKGSRNVKFFGKNSGNGLSTNQGYKIDNYMLYLTAILETTKDGKFQEYLEPDVYTNAPIREAKKWINSY